MANPVQKKSYASVEQARAVIHKKIERLRRSPYNRRTSAKIAALQAEAGALVLDW